MAQSINSDTFCIDENDERNKTFSDLYDETLCEYDERNQTFSDLYEMFAARANAAQIYKNPKN